MNRKTIIFGNGLGMSIDPEFYSLQNALGKAWENIDFKDTEKKQIKACLPNSGEELAHPKGEEQLSDLHLAASACRTLSKIVPEENPWLTQDGHEFPKNVRRYLHATACELYDSPTTEVENETFFEELAKFLKNTQSHIATLNYDGILYHKLLKLEVLKSNRTCLVDGFSGKDVKFDSKNLEREKQENVGYYLHLHGSPLFQTNNGETTKLKKKNLSSETYGISNCQIVLTHVDRKPSIIASSNLLSTYWRYLGRGIAESSEVILFGYSGCDTHLNEMIQDACDTKPKLKVKIVEYDKAGGEVDRKEFWKRKIGRDIELIQLNNIRNFTEWH